MYFFRSSNSFLKITAAFLLYLSFQFLFVIFIIIDRLRAENTMSVFQSA